MFKSANMVPHGFADEDDSEDEGMPCAHKGKPRRKSHQRPQGSDQIRQAFSKRKKGLVLKAFQLHSLTDAKVFMFIVNDKGTSWAYATPDYSASLNVQVLKQLRALANVPEQAKLFTEVIPGQANAKNTSSNGSSDQTGTQRTEPSTEYVPPSTRTATGSLPSRSRSSYSWGSDAQAPGQQTGDRLARTASNAATVRALQATPQSDEHSPTMPKGRPPSGSSMACGTHASLAAQGGSSFQQYQQHHQQQQQLGGGGGVRGPGMESLTPCVYNLLGQPISAQDSPSDACGGSPSSKLMPPPDALATGRMLAANAQAAAVADGQALAAAAAAAAAMEGGFRVPAVKAEPVTGNWMPMDQQQLLHDGTAQQCWDYNAYAAQQQQLYMQQQAYALQQQHQYVPQQYQQGSYQRLMGPSSGPGNKASSMDIPYAAPSAGTAAGVPWGSLPAGLGAGVLSTAASAADTGALQQQQQQQAVDAFESMQRGLAPLRLAKGPRGTTGDSDGCRSAPAVASAAAAGMGIVLGPPSQWVTFPDEAACAGGVASALRTASDVGVYGGMAGSQAYSSYAPSPNSCANQTSGNGSTPMAGAPQAANAAAALLAQRGGSVSQSSSPTAALSQRMTSILAMNSPQTSPLHPSAMGEQPEQQQYRQQQQQQQAGWVALMGGAYSSSAPMVGVGSAMPTSTGTSGGFQQAWQQPDLGGQPPQQQQHLQQQHNQGAFMPQTDDLLSDPIMDMLMDQPMGQLAPQSHTRVTVDEQHHPKHLSIMQATLKHPQQQQQPQSHLQQQQEQQQQQDARSCQMGQAAPEGGAQAAAVAAGPPCSSGMAWEQSPAGAPPPPPPAAAAGGGDADGAVCSLLSQIPPPPKSDADKVAWQAEVRRIVGTLQPQQRQALLAKLSQQQWLMAQGAPGSGPPAPAPPAPLPAVSAAAAGPPSTGYGRVFGGKQRGPSRLSSNSLAGGPEGAPGGPGADATGAAQGAAAVVASAPCSAMLQHQQLPVGSTCFLGSDGAMPNSNQQQGQLAQQQVAGSSAAAGPQAAAGSMGAPHAPVYCASMGFAATAMDLDPQSFAASMPPPVSYAAAAFSQGGSSSSTGGQMLPLQQQQQLPMPAPQPTLAACNAGSSTMFAGNVQLQQQPGSSSSSAFMQPPVATGRTGALLSEAKSNEGSRCPSPLKRSHGQPAGSAFFSRSGEVAAAAAGPAAAEEGASPMKRVCFASAFSDTQPQQPQQLQHGLPEPPSFATLLQAEASGEDDAIAWATAAASDSLKRVTGSCVSLGVSNAFGSLESFPSAFLRLGSLQHGDSLAMLGALPDLGEAGADAIAEEASICPAEGTAAETAAAGVPGAAGVAAAGAGEPQGGGRQTNEAQQPS